MNVEDIQKLIDPETLGISKEELYNKYEEWKMWEKKSIVDGDGYLASTVFGIDFDNKTALYFLLFGLKVFEYRMDMIKEEKNGE